MYRLIRQLFRSVISVTAMARLPSGALRPDRPALLIPMILCGCAVQPTGSDLAMQWHSCRFTVNWPEESAPQLHVDLFLADAVIGPVLEEHDEQLILWRFHRRAARDAAGHRFSFIFYTDDTSRKKIARQIRDSEALQPALSGGVVQSLSCADVDYWSGTSIGATGDERWTPAVSDNWPWYIMGVSRMWLGLIRDLSANIDDDGSTLAERLAHYRKVDDRISDIWHRQGRHALLHHLDAIFGYQGFTEMQSTPQRR